MSPAMTISTPLPATASDGALLAAFAQHRRHDAFAALVERHGGMVLAVCRSVVGNAADAQDAAQAVFLTLAEKAASLKHHRTVAGWLHRVAWFIATRAAAAGAIRRRHEANAGRLKQEHAMTTAHVDAEALHAALERLPEKYRLPLLLHHIEGRTQEETAALLGITPSAASVRLSRARKMLRERLSDTSDAALAEHAAEATSPAFILWATQAVTGKATTSAAALAKAALARMFGAQLNATMIAAAVLAIATAATYVAVTDNAAPPPTPVAAPPRLAVAIPAATQKYKGWVHVSSPEMKFPGHLNTANGNNAGAFELNRRASANAGDFVAMFEDYDTGLSYEYASSTNTLIFGHQAPPPYGQTAAERTRIPLTAAEVLDSLYTVYGRDSVQVTATAEGDRIRCDIAVTGPAKESKVFEFLPSNTVPTTLWIEPASGLIREALVNGNKAQYTYGDPAITSIYDIGVPKTAKIIDDRETPETIAAYDHLMAIASKPFPDGVLVALSDSQIALYERSEGRWEYRYYRNGAAAPKALQIPVPDDWTTTGADELFRHLAEALPPEAFGGDDTHYWQRRFDIGKRTEVRTAGPAEVVGDQAHWMARHFTPGEYIYPQDATNARWSLSAHLALITDRARPNLVGFHGTGNDTPDDPTSITDEWVDPAHDFRAVEFSRTEYKSKGGMELVRSSRKEFGDYAPLPDGRSIPTSITSTTVTMTAARGRVETTSQTTLHFFPSRTLPPLPPRSLP